MGQKTNQNLKPVGYKALIKLFDLSVIPHYRTSYVAMHGRAQVRYENYHEIHILTKHYKLADDSVCNHIEFALKYDGVNLEILRAIFDNIETEELTGYIKKSPTGKYARIIWFLYEWLTEKKLSIADVKQGNYVDVLDGKKYYLGEPVRSKRHRVVNNLLGTQYFCPIIRKTELLINYEQLQLDQKVRTLIASYDEKIITRAAQCLFTKETISSYKIERETPSKKREAEQNYVGETINPYLQKIHLFLVNYDSAKLAVQEIIDMPDKLIDLIIKFIYQNHGVLAKSKRSRYFELLTDDEVLKLEKIISKIMDI